MGFSSRSQSMGESLPNRVQCLVQVHKIQFVELKKTFNRMPQGILSRVLQDCELSSHVGLKEWPSAEKGWSTHSGS